MSEDTQIVEGKQEVEKVVASRTIAEQVKETLEGSADTVKTKVVDKLVNDQIDKRVASVLKGLDDATKLRNSIKGIKPDTQTFDADGKVIQEGYSKAKLDELNKSKAELNKLEDALTLAINENKYEKLNQVVKA